jgi:hypothetical protein
MRTIAMMLVLLLSTVSVQTAASEEFESLQSKIRNVTRPSGRQSAVLTGRVAPSADARAITTTVRVGVSTAVLRGRIGRSGRLHAIGRRLDLGTVAGPFDEIEVEFAGGLEATLVFPFPNCVREAHGRRLDCQGEVGGSGTLVDGAYDVTFDYGGGSAPIDGVGRLTSAADGTLSLLLHQGDLDYASLAVASDFGVSGYFIQGGDAFISVTGTADDVSSPDAAGLTGNVAARNSLPLHVGFVLQRLIAGTPSTLGGTWDVHLQGSPLGGPGIDGTMALTLAVPADGLRIERTRDRRADGRRHRIHAPRRLLPGRPEWRAALRAVDHEPTRHGDAALPRRARCRERHGAWRILDRLGTGARYRGQLDGGAAERTVADLSCPPTETVDHADEVTS